MTRKPVEKPTTGKRRLGLGAGIAAAVPLALALIVPAALKPSTPAVSGGPAPTNVVKPIVTGAHLPIFFGALHAHTSYSDGSGTPAEAFAHARDQGRMQFFAVTEHNHSLADGTGERQDGLLIATQPALYNGSDPGSLISAARTATVDNKFVAIVGQEFSTISSGNHLCVFDIDSVIDAPSGDYANLYDTWLPKHPDSLGEPPLAQFNHPDFRSDIENPSTGAKELDNDYGYDDYEKKFSELLKHAEKYVGLIEMVSGPALTKDGTNLPIKSGNRHEKDYWFYLNQGFHIAPTANQDNHYRNWGTITRARTGVLAERLTKVDILRALKARRVYASEDDNLQLRFLVNGQQMGSVIRTLQPLELNIEVEVIDPDEPGAEYTIELYRDEIGGDMIKDSVDKEEREGDGSVSFTGQRFESGKTFFFIKVSQAGSDGKEEFAWTAPVWIETGAPLTPNLAPAPAPGISPVPAPTFVYSAKSEVYHYANCADVGNIKPENRIESAVQPEDRILHKNCPRVRH